MSEEKFFTFDDWLEGILPPPSEDPDLFRRADDYGGVKHIESLVYNGKMKQEEADKINDAKRKAFHESVKINSRLLFKIHKARAEKSRDKEQYVRSIISEVDEEITAKILRSINTGDEDITGILADHYADLKEREVSNQKVPKRLIENDVDWHDKKVLIYFNEFQKYSYMYETKMLLKDHFKFINESAAKSRRNSRKSSTEEPSAKKYDLSSAEGKIKFIEAIYQYGNKNGSTTYRKALLKANKKAGFRLYQDEDVFHRARNGFNKRKNNNKE